MHQPDALSGVIYAHIEQVGLVQREQQVEVDFMRLEGVSMASEPCGALRMSTQLWRKGLRTIGGVTFDSASHLNAPAMI